jgi:hypothetical protein
MNEWTPTGSSRVPEAGDAAMCINCGAVSILTAFGTLREPSMEEMHTIVTSPGYQQARHALAHIMGERG